MCNNIIFNKKLHSDVKFGQWLRGKSKHYVLWLDYLIRHAVQFIINEMVNGDGEPCWDKYKKHASQVTDIVGVVTTNVVQSDLISHLRQGILSKEIEQEEDRWENHNNDKGCCEELNLNCLLTTTGRGQ